MSLTKRFQEDIDNLTHRAAEAAWLETSTERMAAIRRVFQDCGSSALIYNDPPTITDLFVKAVSKAFMDARKAKIYRVAG
jgi:hypothetical protein